jgi:hypothetical protein
MTLVSLRFLFSHPKVFHPKDPPAVNIRRTGDGGCVAAPCGNTRVRIPSEVDSFLPREKIKNDISSGKTAPSGTYGIRHPAVRVRDHDAGEPLPHRR